MSELEPTRASQECPIDCPNRVQKATEAKGKIGSYGFALLLGFLLLTFSYERSPNGQWQPRESPPIGVMILLTTALGTCLGVQIPLDKFGALFGRN